MSCSRCCPLHCQISLICVNIGACGWVTREREEKFNIKQGVRQCLGRGSLGSKEDDKRKKRRRGEPNRRGEQPRGIGEKSNGEFGTMKQERFQKFPSANMGK